MRILLTGAGGQLGHDLKLSLPLALSLPLVGGRLSLPLVGRVGEGVEVHPFDHAQLDIADAQAVQSAVQQVRPDWIINAAAFNDVDAAETNRDKAFAVNAEGPGHLAEAAAAVGARMLHVSTDYVFDGRKRTPYTEDDPPAPLSVYGQSKLAGEQRVLESGAFACVVRTAWLYGHHGKNFVFAIQAAARQGGPLRVVADQAGSPTYTADLARVIAELVRRPIQGLLHVVNGGSCSRYDQARAIVGTDVEVIPITSAQAARPAPRPAYSALTSVRWPETGLPPMRSWQEALQAFLREEVVA